MEKLENGLKMFASICKYYSDVVIPFCKGKYSEFQLSDEMLNYVRFAFISNILTFSKEDTIENYKSKIFKKDLKKVALRLCVKKGKKLIVDGYIFASSTELITTVRNKIAHGDYILNAKIGEVTLLKGNGLSKNIKISLSKLDKMVVSLFGKSLTFPKGNIHRRSFAYSTKVEKNRLFPISSKDELCEFLQTFHLINITLINKKNKNIDENVFNEFERIRLLYAEDQDETLFSSFNEKYKEEYEITYDIVNIDEEKTESFGNFIFSELGSILDYQSQIKLACCEVQTLLDSENGVKNFISSNLTNLIIIDEIFIKNIKDTETLREELSKTMEFVFNYYFPFSTSIALFNSIFSYNLDELFKNRLDGEFKGLDYSIFDLSKLEILKKKDYENGYINELLSLKKAKQKSIEKINIKIKEKKKQYSNFSKKENLSSKDIEILKKLKTSLFNLKELLLSDEEELSKISNELLDYSTFVFENMESLQNEIIIESIRNSIMHGNYYLDKLSDDKIKIVFNDIYDGDITFSAQISLSDFMNIIVSGMEKIRDDYFSNNTLRKVLK